VIVHAQGAAIAHEMLRCRNWPKTALFVSLGSGLSKLTEVRQAMERGNGTLWGASASALAAVAVTYSMLRVGGATALSVVGAIVMTGLSLTALYLRMLGSIFDLVLHFLRKREPKGFLSGCWWRLSVISGTFTVVFTTLGIAYFSLSWYLTKVFEPTGRTSFMYLAMTFALLFAFVLLSLLGSKLKAFEFYSGPETHSKGDTLPRDYALPASIRWIDFFARSDPVPNGPLVPRVDRIPLERFESYAVENRASFFFDHVSYWLNPEQVVSRLGDELLTLSGLPRKLPEWRAAVRIGRVHALRVSRVLVLLCSLALAVTWWSQIVTFASEYTDTMAGILRRTPLLGTYLSEAFLASKAQEHAAWVIVLASIALLYGMLNGLWIAWDYGASNKFEKSNPDAHIVSKPLFYGLTWLFVLITILLLICRVAIDVFSLSIPTLY